MKQWKLSSLGMEAIEHHMNWRRHAQYEAALNGPQVRETLTLEETQVINLLNSGIGGDSPMNRLTDAPIGIGDDSSESSLSARHLMRCAPGSGDSRADEPPATRRRLRAFEGA